MLFNIVMQLTEGLVQRTDADAAGACRSTGQRRKPRPPLIVPETFAFLHIV
jgi:hypothetical protein